MIPCNYIILYLCFNPLVASCCLGLTCTHMHTRATCETACHATHARQCQSAPLSFSSHSEDRAQNTDWTASSRPEAMMCNLQRAAGTGGPGLRSAGAEAAPDMSRACFGASRLAHHSEDPEDPQDAQKPGTEALSWRAIGFQLNSWERNSKRVQSVRPPKMHRRLACKQEQRRMGRDGEGVGLNWAGGLYV